MTVLYDTIENSSQSADLLRRGTLPRDTRQLVAALRAGDDRHWQDLEEMLRALIRDWGGWTGDYLIYTFDAFGNIDIKGVAFPGREYDNIGLDEWLLELERLGLRSAQEGA